MVFGSSLAEREWQPGPTCNHTVPAARFPIYTDSLWSTYHGFAAFFSLRNARTTDVVDTLARPTHISQHQQLALRPLAVMSVHHRRATALNKRDTKSLAPWDLGQ
eukprot:6726289-Prymnesium_polylepis.1